jgi:hypothetical protein
LQKFSRFNLSAGLRACNCCNLHGFIIKRHLKTRQTVVWGIPSSRLARFVEFLGLRTKLSLILSTLTSDTRGRLAFYTNILFPRTADTTDGCSEHLVVQYRNVDETHAAR